jgi:hypothetical protein
VNNFKFLQFKNILLATYLVCFCFLTKVNAKHSISHNPTEETVKIAFISKFAKYIDNNWIRDNKIKLCILGKIHNLDDIKSTFKNTSINSYQLQILDVKDSYIVKKECNILYFSKLYRSDPKIIIDKFYKLLSIGDLRYFTDNGGIIEFFNYRGKVRFKINEQAAKKANIVFNSKLLELGELR